MYWIKGKYVNNDGKIIGEVKKVNDCDWEAYLGTYLLGRYINHASATKALEYHCQVPESRKLI